MLLMSSHISLELPALKAFFESIKKCYDDTSNSKPCDVLAIVFSGVIVMADIATIGIAARVVIGLKAFQKTYLLAVRIEQALEAASAAGKVIGNKISAVKTYFKNLGTRAIKTSSNYFEGVLDVMKNKLSNYWDDLPECGQNCMSQAEDVMTKEGDSFARVVDDVGDDTTDLLKKAQAKGCIKAGILKTVWTYIVQSSRELAENLADEIAEFSIGYLSEYLFGVSPNGTRGRLTTQASSVIRECDSAKKLKDGINGNRTHATNTEYDTIPKNQKPQFDNDAAKKHKNYDAFLRFMSAHHIVPETFESEGPCERVYFFKVNNKEIPKTDNNLCKDMRNILASVDINVSFDPCNGVLLPDTGPMKTAVKSGEFKPDAMDKIADGMLEIFALLGANPRDHRNIHSKLAINTTYVIFSRNLARLGFYIKNAISNEYEIAPNTTPDEKKANRLRVCTALQVVALDMFKGTGTGAEYENFIVTGKPDLNLSFETRVIRAKASNWKASK
jgi:hypothetical protein